MADEADDRGGEAGRRRPGRWTADTETAFLLALRATGTVTGACAAIGRSMNGAQYRRARHPGFADRWRAVLDALEALPRGGPDAGRRDAGDGGTTGRTTGSRTGSATTGGRPRRGARSCAC